jgi:hypothetical protein
MATKHYGTYSEARQRAYFRCARELYGIAADVVADTLNDPLPYSRRTLEWAQSVAQSAFKKGDAAETLGHEECLTSTRDENLLYKHRRNATKACVRLQSYLDSTDDSLVVDAA